jgi:hypothetical protein
MSGCNLLQIEIISTSSCVRPDPLNSISFAPRYSISGTRTRATDLKNMAKTSEEPIEPYGFGLLPDEVLENIGMMTKLIVVEADALFEIHRTSATQSFTCRTMRW